MTRIILDANVWISFLLGPSKGGVIDQVAQAALGGDFELVVPQELLDELSAVYSKSTYLKSHILASGFDALVRQLSIDVVVLPVERQTGQYSRDPKDDYLINYSLILAVDYVVTGDQDLLALQRVNHARIVTPGQFLELFS